MWDGLFMLLTLSAVMAIASFAAGSLPLALTLSPRQLRFITALGSGVLVGTALIVIIPEGIETMYSAGSKESHEKPHSGRRADDHDHEHSGREPHAWVGIMLILGFILMYLIDVLPNVLGTSQNAYQPLHISLSNLSRGLHRAESPTEPDAPLPSEPRASKSTATSIGLIIHAIADGIALGASSSTPSTSLSFIIFLAIMLHKAPASFGLTSVLLKQGVSKRLARTHLLVFALAAPAGALGTWLAVNLLGRGSLGDESSMAFSTGCVLIFSGGTFLYVAMHAMQESNSSHSHNEGANGYGDPYGLRRHASPGPDKQTTAEVAISVAGMLVPLLTQFGHAH